MCAFYQINLFLNKYIFKSSQINGLNNPIMYIVYIYTILKKIKLMLNKKKVLLLHTTLI